MVARSTLLSAVASAAVASAGPTRLTSGPNPVANGEKAPVMDAPNLGKFVPSYPEVYTISGVMHIPYANIHEPIKVETNEAKRDQKVTYYNGRDAMLYRDIGTDHGMTYESYIGYNKPMCFQTKMKKNADTQDRMDREVKFIPDLATFEYRGLTRCDPSNSNKQLCHHWSQEKAQGFHSEYVFYAKDDGVYTPYLLTMVGRNVVFASHYDLYRLEYLSFAAGVEPGCFDVPVDCSTSLGDRDAHHHATRNEIDSLMNGHDHVSDKFDEFMNKYSKKYESEKEHLERFLNFRVAHHTVNNLNRQADGITYAPNHVMDLSEGEKKQHMFGYRPAYKFKPSDYVHINATVSKMIVDTERVIPADVDWRRDGAVTPVKDQGTCGSCWAFSTTGALEGAYFLKTGRLQTLSEQQLMDCSWAYTNNGCDGGEPAMAMDYIVESKGIENDVTYAYENANNYCRYSDNNKAASLKGRVLVPSGDEFALKQAVALHGPISIAFDASKPSLLYYSSGVYRDPKCSSTDLDHAVLVVGYGSEEGDDYWIVKNSWSTYWGDMGYLKIARNQNNHCGIATVATYVTV